jgi:hypothetical protein
MAKQQPQPTIDNSKDKSLIMAYTDKLGNKYYGFIDPEAMPKKRIVACERATRFAEMYISERTLKKSFEAMIAAGNKGDLVTMCSILKECQYRLEFLGESESLLEVAACYFLFENEDPYELFPSDIQKKMELWEHDKMATNFFLSMVIPLMKSYSTKSPAEIQAYLESSQHEEVASRLHRYI